MHYLLSSVGFWYLFIPFDWGLSKNGCFSFQCNFQGLKQSTLSCNLFSSQNIELSQQLLLMILPILLISKQSLFNKNVSIIFDSQSNSLIRFWINSLRWKNLSNTTCLTMKFHNFHPNNVHIQHIFLCLQGKSWLQSVILPPSHNASFHTIFSIEI